MGRTKERRKRGTSAVAAEADGYYEGTVEGTVVAQYEDGLIALEGRALWYRITTYLRSL